MVNNGINHHWNDTLGFFQLLPEDIHIRANGRLFVSVTSVYSGENIIISNYSSKKELVDVSGKLELDAVSACLFVNGTLGHLGCGI